MPADPPPPAPEPEPGFTHSISMRLRRTTVEERYVRVPVTDAVMRRDPSGDGSARLDVNSVLETAVRMGGDDDGWIREERYVEAHPVQKAPDRT